MNDIDDQPREFLLNTSFTKSITSGQYNKINISFHSNNSSMSFNINKIDSSPKLKLSNKNSIISGEYQFDNKRLIESPYKNTLLMDIDNKSISHQQSQFEESFNNCFNNNILYSSCYYNKYTPENMTSNISNIHSSSNNILSNYSNKITEYSNIINTGWCFDGTNENEDVFMEEEEDDVMGDEEEMSNNVQINQIENEMIGIHKNINNLNYNSREGSKIIIKWEDNSKLKSKKVTFHPKQLMFYSKKEQSNKRQKDVTKNKCCTCKQAKCVKLYCECFANGEYCNEECSCNHCFNKEEFDEIRNKMKIYLKKRNKTAFKSKILKENSLEKHFKGCKCKNSYCLKNYCECFQFGVGCSDDCRCRDCKNTIFIDSYNLEKREKNRKEMC